MLEDPGTETPEPTPKKFNDMNAEERAVWIAELMRLAEASQKAYPLTEEQIEEELRSNRLGD